MTSAVMMDRTNMGVQGMTGMTPSNGGMPTMSPTGANYLMVPRCTFRFEKCQGGMKITCVCDDPMARSMMQNLCTMLAGGMCILLLHDERHDGLLLQPDDGHVQVRDDRQGLLHHLHHRRSEVLRDDPGCCDCISACCKAGCTCCVMMNNTPVCCGYSESYAKTTTTSSSVKNRSTQDNARSACLALALAKSTLRQPSSLWSYLRGLVSFSPASCRRRRFASTSSGLASMA